MISDDLSLYDADPFVVDPPAALLRQARRQRDAWRRACLATMGALLCAIGAGLLGTWQQPHHWQALAVLGVLCWLTVAGMFLAVPVMTHRTSGRHDPR